MEDNGWTVTSLAAELSRRARRRVGENPQTYHHLIQSDEVRRCRRSRRTLLAKVLAVPETYLAGEPFVMPAIGYLPLAPELLTSARITLAAGRLLARCVAACLRDLKRQLERPGVPGRLSPAEEVVGFVAWTLAQVLSPRVWRGRLVAGAPAQPWTELVPFPGPKGAAWQPSLAPEHEAAALALCTAWEHALEPWLSGDAPLNYRRLWELAVYVNPTAGAVLPENWRLDAAPDAGIEDPMSPYAVIDWPSLEQSQRKSAARKKHPRTKKKRRLKK